MVVSSAIFAACGPIDACCCLLFSIVTQWQQLHINSDRMTTIMNLFTTLDPSNNNDNNRESLNCLRSHTRPGLPAGDSVLFWRWRWCNNNNNNNNIKPAKTAGATTTTTRLEDEHWKMNIVVREDEGRKINIILGRWTIATTCNWDCLLQLPLVIAIVIASDLQTGRSFAPWASTFCSDGGANRVGLFAPTKSLSLLWWQFLSLSLSMIKFALFPAKTSSKDQLCSLAGKHLFLPFHWDLSNTCIFKSTSSESSWGLLRGEFLKCSKSASSITTDYTVFPHVIGIWFTQDFTVLRDLQPLWFTQDFTLLLELRILPCFMV